MWLTNLYRKWADRKTVVVEPVEVAPRNARLACLDELEKLNPDLFSLYQVDSGEQTFITPQFPNIDLYADRLKEAASLINRGKPIKNIWVPKEGHRMNVDTFMVTKDGFYLDNYKAVERFKEHAIAMCIALEKSDTEQFGVYEHNLRMLTKLLTNVQDVTVALNHVGEMN